jgi:acylphosphatase
MLRVASRAQPSGGRVPAPVIYTVAMRVARRYVLNGRVQGVGFRFFAERTARLEGISGWVTNRDDGAVEVYAEGDRESMDRFDRRLRAGPPAARVDKVWVDDDIPTVHARGFQVR